MRDDVGSKRIPFRRDPELDTAQQRLGRRSIRVSTRKRTWQAGSRRMVQVPALPSVTSPVRADARTRFFPGANTHKRSESEEVLLRLPGRWDRQLETARCVARAFDHRLRCAPARRILARFPPDVRRPDRFANLVDDATRDFCAVDSMIALIVGVVPVPACRPAGSKPTPGPHGARAQSH